jgi:hypothetical protein
MSTLSAAGLAALLSAVGRFDDCAREISYVGISILSDPESFSEKLRRLRRDLPYLNQQALANIPTDEPLAAKLQHELACAEEDALRMADWAVSAQAELERLLRSYTPSSSPDAAERFGQAQNQAFAKAGGLQQAIFVSCNCALETVNAIRATAERAGEQPGGSPGDQGETAGEREATGGGEGDARNTTGDQGEQQAEDLRTLQTDPELISEREGEADELTDRQRSILEVMIKEGITSERRRKTRADIVRLINRLHKAETYSHDFAVLGKRGLLKSLQGPKGGVWISPLRVSDAQRLCLAKNARTNCNTTVK